MAQKLGVLPPGAAYKYLQHETPMEHVKRTHLQSEVASHLEMVHPQAAARNPLPFNIADRAMLPDESGWWGYSMRDVPSRTSSPTYLAKIADAKIILAVDGRGQFCPAILTGDKRALNLREIVFRDPHIAILRRNPPARNLKRATWLFERVYDNHSHWLTAHLPKLCLLRDRDELADLLLPEELTPAIRTSFATLGIDPAAYRTFKTGEVLEVEELTVLVTDRFRGELLRPVRDAFTSPNEAGAHRRIYISRAKAAMRQLANEEEVWPLFAEAGFERVFMEDLSFEDQIQLMSQTKVLAAPHGAGLTNMMFCPPGGYVIEIAWLGFPNPNFYALASAMNLSYGLVPAQDSDGGGDPLRRDLSVEPAAVKEVLHVLNERLQAEPPS